MTRRRRTLGRMELDQATQDRLTREVRDLVIEQGGIWPSVEVALERRYGGEELDEAMTAAVGLILAYRSPGGPAHFVRWREREPVSEPDRPRKRGWRVA